MLKKWIVFGFVMSFVAHAADTSQLSFQSELKKVIEKNYMGARIEFQSSITWAQGEAPTETSPIKILTDNQRGNVIFSVGSENPTVGTVNYSAWVSAPIAKRRIQPGEKLNKDLFQIREVNVSQGLDREYRGIILDPATDFSKLEARQTILEGQYPVTTGVQKMPDVRRGDVVQVKVHTGSVILTTQGIAQEISYINENVRILTAKTKKEMIGKLQADNQVEVHL